MADFARICKPTKLSNLFLQTYAQMIDEEPAMAQKYLDVLIALAPEVKLNKENQFQIMESS